MVLEGTIKNGMIVLDHPPVLPEGSRVEVVVKPTAQEASPLGEMLLRHAGKALWMTEELACQHDYYLDCSPFLG